MSPFPIPFQHCKWQEVNHFTTSWSVKDGESGLTATTENTHTCMSHGNEHVLIYNPPNPIQDIRRHMVSKSTRHLSDVETISILYELLPGTQSVTLVFSVE